MRTGIWRTFRAFSLIALGVVACGGETSRGGSETNWFVSCSKDSDCTAGVCACGICTEVCTPESECPGGGKMRCVQLGSTAHEQLCLTVRDAPDGLCLAACAGDGDCQGNERCVDGACAPDPEWTLDHPRAAPTGSPCVPDSLRRSDFAGYDPDEVSVEEASPSCMSALCLVNNFQGRHGCPYGSPCMTTGDDGVTVTRDVLPQIVSRAPADVSTCSCRCNGPAGTGPFCACPVDFECRPVVGSFGGPSELAGSYCVKRGTAIDHPSELGTAQRCDRALANCEGR